MFLLIRTLPRRRQENTLSLALMMTMRRRKTTLKKSSRPPQRFLNQKRRYLRTATQRRRPQVTRHRPIRKALLRRRWVKNLRSTCDLMETRFWKLSLFKSANNCCVWGRQCIKNNDLNKQNLSGDFVKLILLFSCSNLVLSCSVAVGMRRTGMKKM